MSRAGRFRESSERVLVLRALVDRHLCYPCLSRVTALSVEDVKAILDSMAGKLRVYVIENACDRCAAFTVVVSLSQMTFGMRRRLAS